MTLYLFIIMFFLNLTFFQFCSKKHYKTFLIMSLGILTFLICFRDFSIGNDTREYVRIFNSIASESETFAMNRFEIGFIMYNKIISLISKNPHFFIFITGFITSIGYYHLIKTKSSNYVFSVLLFLLLGFFSHSTNVLREQLAMVFIFFAYDYLGENNYKLFFCFVFFAFLFHKSAIVFLVVALLKKIKLNKKNLFILGLVTFLMYIFFTPILNQIFNMLNFYDDYSNSIYRNGVVRIATIVQIFVNISIIFFVIFIKKYYKFNKYTLERIDYNNMIWFLLITLVINILSIKFVILNRCTYYFYVYAIVFIPNIINVIKNKKQKVYISLILTICFIIQFFVIQIYRPEWNVIYPYSFFW